MMRFSNRLLLKALFPAFLLLLGSCRSISTPAAETASNSWPDGVAYEIFVQAFADANGDGIGDLKGATARLDYLQDLGVRAVWLMPIGPSPSYHKYDVTDYRNVHPDYGTLADFKTFVAEAHRRNIRVVIDLVVNHSSREHPWFKEAVAHPDGPYHDYYVWKTREQIQREGEGKQASADSDNLRAWHDVPGSDQLFYAYFGGHMPDLNFDNPAVRREIIDIGRFWLNDVGVDGFRLDAAKHIFPDDRATDSHAWWVEFKQAMQAAKPDVYLVGEVWDRSEVVAPYLKGLTALFNFDLGYAISNAARDERGDSLIHRLKRTRDFYRSIDPVFRDAIFITNHDQNRTMNVVGGKPERARMAAAILLTLPGSPYVYYGEEIGMRGMKPDEHIREPFVWGGDAARYETRWITPRHSVPDSVTSAARQAGAPSSLLNHYRSLIALRNGSPILTRGDVRPEDLGAAATLSYMRVLGEESLWVVHNLGATPVTVGIPSALRTYRDIQYRSNPALTLSNGSIVLPAYSTAVLGR